MRRIALILVPVLLSGCNYVGNPAAGFGGFAGDIFSWRGNPNRPLLDSPNARRVMGTQVDVVPLESEPGNVWPGPLPPAKTIGDLQRDHAQGAPIDAPVGRVNPPAPPAPAIVTVPRAAPPAAIQPAAAQPRGRVLQTPGGPATTIIGGNGVETFTLPNGRSGIVMPNANGTLTLIGPDGTTQVVQAPR